MPTYRVTAPDGRRVRLTGDSPPTEAELEEIFAKLPAPKAKAAPDMSAPEVREVTDQLPAVYVPGLPAIPRGVVTGALKGLGRTVVGLGRMVKSAGGLGELSPEDAAAFQAAEEALASQSSAERAGAGAEQAAEFLAIPGPGKVAGAAKAIELLKAGVAASGLARAQGASPREAMATGMLAGVAGPAREGVGWAAGKLGKGLVRQVLKPTVAAMQRISGARGEGINVKAERLIQFIIDNRLFSSDKAQKVLTEAEQELQRILSLKNAPTDAPARAARYLAALEKSAQRQGLATETVSVLRAKTQELLEGVLGEDVIGLVPGKGAEAIGGLVPKVVGRAPRSDVTAREALESARASSRWSTGGQWGEKSHAEAVTTVAKKAVERAERDAVKVAVKETAPLLRRESELLTARDALDRMAFREGNRDLAGLAGAIEMGTGNLPVVGWAARLLRSGSLRAGVLTGALEKAIREGDGYQVAFILQKLGVGVSPQLMRAAGP